MGDAAPPQHTNLKSNKARFNFSLSLGEKVTRERRPLFYPDSVFSGVLVATIEDCPRGYLMSLRILEEEVAIGYIIEIHSVSRFSINHVIKMRLEIFQTMFINSLFKSR